MVIRLRQCMTRHEFVQSPAHYDGTRLAPFLSQEGVTYFLPYALLLYVLLLLILNRVLKRIGIRMDTCWRGKKCPSRRITGRQRCVAAAAVVRT